MSKLHYPAPPFFISSKVSLKLCYGAGLEEKTANVGGIYTAEREIRGIFLKECSIPGIGYSEHWY